MKRTYKLGLPKWGVLLAVMGCVGSLAAIQVHSRQEGSELAYMMGKMKTVCVGRFLVDVPVQAEVALSHEMISGFEIETVEESEAAFHDRMSDREADINRVAGDRKRGAEGGMIEALDVVLDSTPGRPQGEGLLERVAKTDAEAGAAESLRVTKLRLGKRRINGMSGEESLERVREFNLATTYGFLWEARGVTGDVMRPFLSLELQSGIGPRPGGPPVNSSLHQDAILALWDGISSTIRLRKSAPSQP